MPPLGRRSPHVWYVTDAIKPLDHKPVSDWRLSMPLSDCNLSSRGRVPKSGSIQNRFNTITRVGFFAQRPRRRSAFLSMASISARMEILHNYWRAEKTRHEQPKKLGLHFKCCGLQSISPYLVIFSPVLCCACTKFLQFALLVENA